MPLSPPRRWNSRTHRFLGSKLPQQGDSLLLFWRNAENLGKMFTRRIAIAQLNRDFRQIQMCRQGVRVQPENILEAVDGLRKIIGLHINQRQVMEGLSK